MGFRCPDCAGNDTLQTGRSIELGADARSDEISLQLLACSACAFRGIAVYQESRRGAIDDECVEHTGFRIPVAQHALIDQLLASCPRPRDSSCNCAAHRQLQQFDAAGRWNALATRGVDNGFVMHLAR